MSADDDKKPQDEDIYRFSQKMTSEPVVLLTALAIFVLCAVINEWETIWDALARLFTGK